MFSCHTQAQLPANLLGTNTNVIIVMLSSAEIHKCVNTLQLFSLCQLFVNQYVIASVRLPMRALQKTMNCAPVRRETV